MAQAWSTHPPRVFPEHIWKASGRGVRVEVDGDCYSQVGDGLAGNQIHEVTQALRLVALFTLIKLFIIVGFLILFDRTNVFLALTK